MATPKPKMGNGKVEKVMKAHKEGKLSPKQKKIHLKTLKERKCM